MSDAMLYILLGLVLLALVCLACSYLNAKYCAPGDYWWDRSASDEDAAE